RRLEHTARAPPHRALHSRHSRPAAAVDPALNALPDLDRPQQAAQLRQLLSQTRGTGPRYAEVVRVALEYAPQLGETFAREALDALAPAQQQAPGHPGRQAC